MHADQLTLSLGDQVLAIARHIMPLRLLQQAQASATEQLPRQPPAPHVPRQAPNTLPTAPGEMVATRQSRLHATSGSSAMGSVPGAREHAAGSQAPHSLARATQAAFASTEPAPASSTPAGVAGSGAAQQERPSVQTSRVSKASRWTTAVEMSSVVSTARPCSQLLQPPLSHEQVLAGVTLRSLACHTSHMSPQMRILLWLVLCNCAFGPPQ